MQGKRCAYTVGDLSGVVSGDVSLCERAKKTAECRLDESPFKTLYVGDIISVPESLLHRKVIVMWAWYTESYQPFIWMQLEGVVDE